MSHPLRGWVCKPTKTANHGTITPSSSDACGMVWSVAAAISAGLGAYQNRFSSVVARLMTTAQNLGGHAWQALADQARLA